MARRISMVARSELLEAVGARYRGAPRSERSRILDEFAAVTGYHRKHAIRLLSGAVRDAKVEGCSPGIAKPMAARRIRSRRVHARRGTGRFCRPWR